MNSIRKSSPMTRIKVGAVIAGLLIFAMAIGVRPAAADDTQNARQLVDKASLTFASFAADKYMGGGLQALVRKAKGVLVYPQVLRGAFILGISGGSGVLLVRDQASGEWSGPAFYTMGEASFGLQAGGDASEVVLVAMTHRGVSALLATSAKLGADASVAVGPVGMGAQAATANLSADIISYSRAKGLYAGISLEGAVVATRDGLNRAYYGKEITPTDILVHRAVTNPQAKGLIAAVEKVAEGNRAVQSRVTTQPAQ